MAQIDVNTALEVVRQAGAAATVADPLQAQKEQEQSRKAEDSEAVRADRDSARRDGAETAGGSEQANRIDASRSAVVSQILEALRGELDVSVRDQGYLAVQDTRSTGIAFQRRGGFALNDAGQLADNGSGRVLLGTPTDSTGTPRATRLEPISVARVEFPPRATTRISLGGNLPSDAPTGTRFETPVRVFDSAGTAHRVPVSFTNSQGNNFVFAVGNASAETTGQTSGTVSLVDGESSRAYNMVVSFSHEGSFLGIDLDGDGTVGVEFPPGFTFAGTVTGMPDFEIGFDLIGEEDAVSPLGSYEGEFAITGLVQDGAAEGQLSSLTIAPDGLVIAASNNGEQRPLYRLAIADFPNATAGSPPPLGDDRAPPVDAGEPEFRAPGGYDANTIVITGGIGSSTDVGTEYARFIVAAAAYQGTGSNQGGSGPNTSGAGSTNRGTDPESISEVTP